MAEVLSAVLRDFMEKKIPCQVGIYDRSTGKFRQEKVRKEEDHEHVLYGFLRYGSDEKTPVTVQEYLKNPGAQNFANYIYITGDPEDKEAELLKQKGEVTVIGCGVSSGDNKGEQITWKYGSQNPEDSTKTKYRKQLSDILLETALIGLTAGAGLWLVLEMLTESGQMLPLLGSVLLTALLCSVTERMEKMRHLHKMRRGSGDCRRPVSSVQTDSGWICTLLEYRGRYIWKQSRNLFYPF